jgi:hypothetical protein
MENPLLAVASSVTGPTSIARLPSLVSVGQPRAFIDPEFMEIVEAMPTIRGLDENGSRHLRKSFADP